MTGSLKSWDLKNSAGLFDLRTSESIFEDIRKASLTNAKIECQIIEEEIRQCYLSQKDPHRLDCESRFLVFNKLSKFKEALTVLEGDFYEEKDH